MKNLWVLLALVSLSACVPPPESYWEKPGADQQDLDKDKYACMREAAQDAPPAPGQVSSFDAYSGEFYNEAVDVNADMRNRLILACMRSRGWQLKERIYLPDGTIQNRTL